MYVEYSFSFLGPVDLGSLKFALSRDPGALGSYGFWILIFVSSWDPGDPGS